MVYLAAALWARWRVEFPWVALSLDLRGRPRAAVSRDSAERLVFQEMPVCSGFCPVYRA